MTTGERSVPASGTLARARVVGTCALAAWYSWTMVEAVLRISAQSLVMSSAVVRADVTVKRITYWPLREAGTQCRAPESTANQLFPDAAPNSNTGTTGYHRAASYRSS